MGCGATPHSVPAMPGEGSGAFLKESDVSTRRFQRVVETGCNPLQRRRPIKTHVRWVAWVVPLVERAFVLDHFGHDRQNASGSQEIVQPNEFQRGLVKMFDRFRRRDEIVGSLERGWIGRKIRIEDRRGKTSFVQHVRQGWSGTRADIDTLGSGREFLDERQGQSVEEIAITWVVGIVFVRQVMGTFRVGPEPLRRVEKNQSTCGTIEIRPVMGRSEGTCVRIVAQRAGDVHGGRERRIRSFRAQ